MTLGGYFLGGRGRGRPMCLMVSHHCEHYWGRDLSRVEDWCFHKLPSQRGASLSVHSRSHSLPQTLEEQDRRSSSCLILCLSMKFNAGFLCELVGRENHQQWLASNTGMQLGKPTHTQMHSYRLAYVHQHFSERAIAQWHKLGTCYPFTSAGTNTFPLIPLLHSFIKHAMWPRKGRFTLTSFTERIVTIDNCDFAPELKLLKYCNISSKWHFLTSLIEKSEKTSALWPHIQLGFDAEWKYPQYPGFGLNLASTSTTDNLKKKRASIKQVKQKQRNWTYSQTRNL